MTFLADESVKRQIVEDFGELVFRRRLIHHCVILTRFENYTPEIRARLIKSLFCPMKKLFRTLLQLFQIEV